MRLGKKPARHDPRTLRLWDYLGDELPPAPESVDWSLAVPYWPMFQNDQLGDCTIAAAAHMIQLWTCNAGDAPSTPSDPEVLEAYERIAGYVPGDQSTDNGAVELDVLNAWRRDGIAGRKILAYTHVRPTNHTEVQDAIVLFGAAYLGVQLPLTAQGADVWDGAPGSDPNSAAGSWGGHAIPAVAYDQSGLTVVTWGKLLRVSWQFFDAYCDEAYAVLSQDWIERSGEAPSGLNLTQLQDDLVKVAG